MREECLQFFARFIEKELGIVYSEQNYFQLENRLEEVAKACSLASVDELYEKARTGIQGTFKRILIDIATNNETSFFRDIRVFLAIENMILPAIAESLAPQEKMRIWSAASSYGQEPFSLAILVSELMKKKIVKSGFSVLASDISERVLERARTGKYSDLEVRRGLTEEMLANYFTQDERKQWALKSEILQSVEFRMQNLKEPLKLDHKYHLILCRNVLIYQKVESKAEILRRISQWLAPGGYLVLGAGESLLGISNDYDTVSFDGVVAYRLKSAVAEKMLTRVA